MKTIGICGAGTMGAGIAQVAAASGYKTVLFDVNNAILKLAEIRIEKDLQHLFNKQKITEEKKAAAWAQLSFTSDIRECVADVIIEAIVEKKEVKLSLFKQLAQWNGPNTIFTSNTSSLSISSIATCLPHPQQMAGLHFFNPAPVMKLVEVVQGKLTSDKVISDLVLLVQTFGKIPVVCKDAPGFIVNRVARPFYIESLRQFEKGLGTVEVLDRLLESKGFRMGPFRLMDLIGNDVNYAVSCSIFEQLGQPGRLEPSYIQKEKVEQGQLGKKTGKGYYNYEDDQGA